MNIIIACLLGIVSLLLATGSISCGIGAYEAINPPSTAKTYEPWSVVCDGKGHFVVADADGKINHFWMYESHERAVRAAIYFRPDETTTEDKSANEARYAAQEIIFNANEWHACQEAKK